MSKSNAARKVEFNPVRANTIQASVIEAMDGKRTFDDIGKRVGIDAAYARAFARQAERRNGIAFKVSHDGRVSLVLPNGKRLEDAIVESKKAARTLEPAKAKAAPKKKVVAKAKAKRARS